MRNAYFILDKCISLLSLVAFLMFWVFILTTIICASIAVDPVGYGYSRLSSSCIVEVQKKDKRLTDIDDWRYNMLLRVRNSTLHIQVWRVCHYDDDNCIQKYNDRFAMKSIHICKYYTRDPQYSPLVDDEPDISPMYITISLIISLCLLLFICIFICILSAARRIYIHLALGYQEV